MSAAAYSWSNLQAAKAQCRIAIKSYTNELAMYEILEAGGGEMKAIDMVGKLITRFGEQEKDPRFLCQAMGYAPDEVVSLSRLVP